MTRLVGTVVIGLESAALSRSDLEQDVNSLDGA